MLYLSQILNSKVTDSSDKVVGRLKDILVKSKAGIYSPLDFLLVQGKKGRKFYIPYECVENLSREEVTLKGLFEHIPADAPEEVHVYLDSHVLDKQIVDVGGARVVRVNDLKLGLFENKMCVLGIDISVKGLLRRLMLNNLDFLPFLKTRLIDWRKAQIVKGRTLRLDTISKDLTRLHPADLANIIEDLSVKQGSRLVRSLDADKAAQVLEEVEPEVQKILVNYLGPAKAADIIAKMPVDELTDLMQILPRAEAQKFLAYIQNGKLKKVEKLIRYDEDTAGGLMTTDFMVARPHWTVARTVEELKRVSPSMRSMLYIYITDDGGVFKGSVSLRRLLITEPERTLADIIKRLPPYSTLRPDYSLSEVMEIFTKYNLYTAAVLDDNKKMVGMVTIDDVMRRLKPKA